MGLLWHENVAYWVLAMAEHAESQPDEPSAGRASSRFLLRARIGAVLAAVALLLVAHQLGILEQLHAPARAKQMLVGLGGWGYLAFILAYALLQPFGVPGTVFIMAAPLIWPWPVAFALSMVGTMAASVIGFSFARFVARDFVASKIPARFRRWEDALARREFATVFVLRLVFWMPPLLHAFFGVSKVRFSTHFWASLLGYVLPLLGVSYFGEALFEGLTKMPGRSWGLLAGALVIIALGVWLARKRRG